MKSEKIDNCMINLELLLRCTSSQIIGETKCYIELHILISHCSLNMQLINKITERSLSIRWFDMSTSHIIIIILLLINNWNLVVDRVTSAGSKCTHLDYQCMLFKIACNMTHWRSLSIDATKKIILYNASTRF